MREREGGNAPQANTFADLIGQGGFLLLTALAVLFVKSHAYRIGGTPNRLLPYDQLVTSLWERDSRARVAQAMSASSPGSR